MPKTPPPEVVDGPRVRELQTALTAASDAQARAATLAAFWTEVAGRGTPLVETIPGDPGHRAVTFLWRERRPDPAASGRDGTRAVVLLANKLTDPSVWEQSVLEHLAGTDVWHRTYRLPADWRASYQLAPDDGVDPVGPSAGEQTGPRSRWAGVAPTAGPDPFCRRHFAGKPGEHPSSVVELDEAPAQPWRDRRPEVPRGTLTEQVVPTGRLDGGPRRVWTYAPAPGSATAGAADHDLLVLLDGEDWAGRLDLVSTLDNLIADGRIPPTVAVLVDAVDTPTRWRELTCTPAFADFLTADLLPWARRALPVRPGPSGTTISGRSLGAITALYAALRSPGLFGAVHAQSPSLWFPAEPLPDGRETGWLRDALVAADTLPPQLSLEVGRQEWLLLGPTRELAAALAARGDGTVRLSEYEGGHDALCWRGGLADALADLAAGRR